MAPAMIPMSSPPVCELIIKSWPRFSGLYQVQQYYRLTSASGRTRHSRFAVVKSLIGVGSCRPHKFHQHPLWCAVSAGRFVFSIRVTIFRSRRPGSWCSCDKCRQSARTTNSRLRPKEPRREAGTRNPKCASPSAPVSRYGNGFSPSAAPSRTSLRPRCIACNPAAPAA